MDNTSGICETIIKMFWRFYPFHNPEDKEKCACKCKYC